MTVLKKCLILLWTLCLTVFLCLIQVLIYSGQLDVIVAAPLTERFLPTVNWTGAAEYKKAPRFHWKVQPGDTEVAGYVRQVGNFCQVSSVSSFSGSNVKSTRWAPVIHPLVMQLIIRGGGHILPYDQPARSFDMIDRFLSTRGWIWNVLLPIKACPHWLLTVDLKDC